MTLRPSDYDKNGDIIPMSCKEDKGDLISRSVLKEIWELYEKYQPSLATNVYEFGVALKGIIDNTSTFEPDGTQLSVAYLKGRLQGQNERPQGEWINTSPNDDKGECSLCCYLSKKYYKFCPNCGTKMRKKEGDNK